MSYYPCERPLVEYVVTKEPCHQDFRQVYVRHVDGIFLRLKDSHRSLLKGISHQPRKAHNKNVGCIHKRLEGELEGLTGD